MRAKEGKKFKKRQHFPEKITENFFITMNVPTNQAFAIFSIDSASALLFFSCS